MLVYGRVERRVGKGRREKGEGESVHHGLLKDERSNAAMFPVVDI